MKLKTFFRMILCSVALLSFVACTDEKETPSFIDDGKICYMGDVVVSDNTSFTDKDIVVELTFDEASKTVEMLIKQVKFAEAMPIRLDMTVQGISYTEAGSDITIAGNNIVPQAMGGPFPKYTITNLSGKVTGEGMVFSMICGELPVSYTGTTVLQ